VEISVEEAVPVIRELYEKMWKGNSNIATVHNCDGDPKTYVIGFIDGKEVIMWGDVYGNTGIHEGEFVFP
jgi:hypothetical protein